MPVWSMIMILHYELSIYISAQWITYILYLYIFFTYNDTIPGFMDVSPVSFNNICDHPVNFMALGSIKKAGW